MFRQLDEQLGFTQGLAAQLVDTRTDPTHSVLEMVRSRLFGIIAGYEDQNDHDALRSDAIFKMIVDRLPEDDDLASQPTLSRFENAVTPADLLRLEDWFIRWFVDSFDESPIEITLDIDVFDDPTHGQQQLTFFHDYYKQYQHLVRAITRAENDLVVLPDKPPEPGSLHSPNTRLPMFVFLTKLAAAPTKKTPRRAIPTRRLTFA